MTSYRPSAKTLPFVLLGLFGILYIYDAGLEQEKILSVRSIDGISVPNIFMPPLYPIFLYLIKLPLITSDYYLDVVFLIQLLISVISILALILIIWLLTK